MPRKRQTETHCANGHPWTEENTRLTRNGGKRCRECNRECNRRAQSGHRGAPGTGAAAIEAAYRKVQDEAVEAAAVAYAEHYGNGVVTRSSATTLGLAWMRPNS